MPKQVVRSSQPCLILRNLPQATKAAPGWKSVSHGHPDAVAPHGAAHLILNSPLLPIRQAHREGQGHAMHRQEALHHQIASMFRPTGWLHIRSREICLASCKLLAHMQ